MNMVLPLAWQQDVRNSETTEQWQLRLMMAANEGKIPGFSFRTILDIIGLEHMEVEEAAIRAEGAKAFNESNRVRADFMDSYGDEEDYKESLSALDEKNLAIKKNLRRIQKEKNAVARLVRDKADMEDMMSGMISACRHELGKAFAPVTPPVKRIGGTREAVTIWSDWHYGEMVNVKIEQYNCAEAERRIDRLVQKVCQMAVADKVQRLHIFSLGDMIAGLIHPTIKIESEISAAEQMGRIAVIISRKVLWLANYIPEIVFYCAGGNHDRTVANQKECEMQETLNYFLLTMMEQAIQWSGATNVKLVKPVDKAGFIETNICDEKFLAYHGHLQRSMNISSHKNQIETWCGDEPPKYVLFGHFHHSSDVNDKNMTFLCNGAMTSTDHYAYAKGLSSIPVQKYFLMEKGIGRHHCTDIKVKE